MRNTFCALAVMIVLAVPTISKGQVYSVPVGGSPYRGPARAKITVVLGCQYSGPFCNRIRPTINQLFSTYRGQVRLVYKHYPVHRQRAMPSHLGACAAHRQKRFAKMHRMLWGTLYPNKQFSAADVRGLAQRLGLNMRRYDRDVAGICGGIVATDQAMLSARATRGTPSWYINGVRIGGAVPFAKIKAVVDSELALANQRIGSGTPMRDYYNKWIVAKGLTKAAPVARRPRTGRHLRRPRRPYPKAATVYSVPIGSSPFIGAADAKVTMVVSVDFNSPYSDRLRPTLEQLHQRYKNDLRIVFKHFVVYPQRSTLPALAACAANRQGKFFEMENDIWNMKRSGYTRNKMEQAAQALGMNMRRFKRDMGSTCQASIKRDKAELSRVGAAGVPASFINGRFLSGARPKVQFETLINVELAKANRRIRAGARKGSYYRTFVERRGKRTP